jgi:hypothetical protein
VARLQHVESLDQRLGHRHEIGAPARAGFGDREHLLFGDGEDFVAVAAVGLETVVDDAGAHFDQLPQHGLVADDLGVCGDVGGRGRRAGEFDQVGAAGDLLAQALRLEPLAERDRVVGTALLREFADGAEDQLVVAAIEIRIDQLVGDAVIGIGRQHQAAEHGLLGFHRLRWHAQLFDPVIGAALESLIGTKPLARAHPCRISPSRIVDAIGVLQTKRHRSRPCGRSVADKTVDNRWASQEMRPRKENGRLPAPVSNPSNLEMLTPLPPAPSPSPEFRRPRAGAR